MKRTNGHPSSLATSGTLAARPDPEGPPTAPGGSGLLPLNESSAGTALLYVPDGCSPEVPNSLVVMLHGAGGAAAHSIDMVRPYADRFGFMLLAAASWGPSWDIISQRRYGVDVAAIDALLGVVFARYRVDPSRLAIAGFSDGASYALSLGIMNGDLFSRILAFSPGFMAPLRERGAPKIFISHGTEDRVLPIARFSRRIVAQLRKAGREVQYTEFDGGHVVPDAVATSAFAALAHDRAG